MKGAIITYDGLNSTSGGYLYDRKLVKKLKKTGFNIKEIELKKKPYIKNIHHNFSKNLIDEIKKTGLDFLLEDELTHPSLFGLNKYINEKLDLSIISIVHHLSFLEKINKDDRASTKFLEKKYLQTVKNYIFNSKSTKETVLDLKNKKVNSIIAKPGKNHISPPEEIKVNNVKETLKIVFIGNIYPHKNIHSIIKAISGMDKVELCIIGNKDVDLNYTKKIKSLINHFSLQNNVKLRGYLSEKQKTKLLKSADLFILPSFFEGYGISTIEALGHGLPVIVSENGGGKEIIKNGEQGYIIDPKNLEEIKQAIVEMKNKSQKLKKMSLKAKKRYNELPTWEESFSKIPQYIEKILN